MPVLRKTDHDGPIEQSLEIAVEMLERLLEDTYTFSPRAVALLLLQGDQEIRDLVKEKQPGIDAEIDALLAAFKSRHSHPVEYEIALRRKEEVDDIIGKVVKVTERPRGFSEQLSRLMMNPLIGFPFLLFTLYVGLFKFVGDLGAGTVVDYLEGHVFQAHLNPFIRNVVYSLVPWPIIQDLLVGDFGMFTFGLKYAVALILPVVTFFFAVFAVIEDTGYLPRAAMLIDRIFKRIGLSGRAVIPMVLGFGCTTMATIVTSTLPTKRERIIATMLLALAVPCSAQLGIVMALLGGRPHAMMLWAGVIAGVFLFVGYLTAQLLPGEKPSFYLELPPLRLPSIANVVSKTYVRVKWYFLEVLPFFLLASFFVWLGKLAHLFDLLLALLRWPVRMIGLPDATAQVFLFGFFRRDYGAAALYDLNANGLLSGIQLVVACVALTLFLPCIAQCLMTMKERGWRTGVGISLFVLVLSFGIAFLLNLVLTTVGATL